MVSDAILSYFYPDDTPLRRMLLKHSMQVRDKALAILDRPECASLSIERDLVIDGAMVHDIGIYLCDAPGILCEGKANYIAHGTLGAQLLRDSIRQGNGFIQGVSADYIESLARICERHTGAGLTREDIVSQQLPIPEGDYLPETLEEKLVCLADKYFSKSGNMQEKPLDRVRHSMMKFGNDSVRRFDALCEVFSIF